MATITHTVVRGDTLSTLAKKYNTTISSIANLNNIKNIHLIYIGQVLYISGKPSSAEDVGVADAGDTNAVTVTAFGLQAGTDRDIFITWNWDKTNTDKYTVVWSYLTANNIWFEGSRSDVTITESIYSAPSNASHVRVTIQPISQTYESNDTEVYYWTANWSSQRMYDFTNLPPETPPVPTVEIEDYTLTCRVDNLNLNGNYIQFEIVKNDSELFKMGTAEIFMSSASYSCSVTAGDNYKVRARATRGDVAYSDWTEYSSNTLTKPSAPTGITSYRATSKTSVFLAWSKVNTAKTYDIEYTTKPEYFEGSNSTTTVNGITSLQYELTGLNMGERYHFRVRAVNDKGESAWTSPVSIVIGTTPIAPTTWSSTSTVVTGEDLVLYWVHNTEDGSKQTYAEIEIYFNDNRVTQTVENTDPSDENKTGQFVVNTSNLVEGAKIRWRIRTSGITMEYGDWSTQREVDVYAPPTLSLEILNNAGKPLTILESFPFYIRGKTGPASQRPISFHLSIVSRSTYETIDGIGNVKMILAGDEVYSNFYDISTELMVEVMPDSIDLQNNVDYDVICTVAMNTGLSSKETSTFKVSWTDEQYSPNAEVSIDREILATHIRPYCEYYPTQHFKVEYVNSKYVKTDILLENMDGISVDNAFTKEGYTVYAGYYNGVMTHFCVVKSEIALPVPDITLSVYRREFNGKFVEIGTKLINTNNTFVTDPHPALDYARYRVVAISNKTGAVSYSDLPAIPMNEESIVLQWGEKWTNFDAENVGAIVEPAWVGSLLKLKYNIDVSENNTNDVTLVSYIGRDVPVSYYGTQNGSTASWSVAIPKSDIETIYSLRRLSNWMGDVYVREPSGTGYWANITISMSRTHNELIIPVTIDLTKVAGGM